MTTNVLIANRALQAIGGRTTVTEAELLNETSNEAKQINLAYDVVRKELLRMAPWDCAFGYASLVYISSLPGTPENTSPATTLWQPGQPYPPWVYEYQYPVDCLKACFIVPQFAGGINSGTPIFPVTIGGAAATWQGPPVKFKVATDKFYPVTAAAVVDGGTGYAVGDYITLEEGATDEPPIGAPAVLKVLTAPGGVIATVEVVNQILGSEDAMGGSYFEPQTNPVAQGSTTGSGTGATFNLTFGAQGSQRVILTNQEYALLAYVRNIEDPNVMDDLFQRAWINVIASKVSYALDGDKGQANALIEIANAAIAEARKADGNEGLTVNDVTPDWIRTRGIVYPDYQVGPGVDWGPAWPTW